jgi:hypothetical protein
MELRRLLGGTGDRAPCGLSATVGCRISASSVARTGDSRFFRSVEPSPFSLGTCPTLAGRDVGFFDREDRGGALAGTVAGRASA